MSEVTRRQRQLDELRALCRRGDVARAIDLAFEHVADFGLDDDMADLLAAAVDHPEAPTCARSRFAELRLSRD